MKKLNEMEVDSLDSLVTLNDVDAKKPVLLTQIEAAAVLKVAVHTLIQYRKKGIVKPIKVVGKVYYDADAIESLRTGGANG
jgi:hypothetical protein